MAISLKPGAAIVAVMFTDLVGSTDIHERLGDDRAHQLWNEHVSLLSSLVAEHGGTVVKTLGDGVMAVFATPSEALGCAIACQRHVSARNRRSPEALSMRVGLSAGEVTIEADDVFGRPVVEAARLCAAAHGGQVLASELVHSLAGERSDVRLGDRLELSLKGLGNVGAHEVAWSGDDATVQSIPPQLGRNEALPFVGRDDELGMLQSAWQQARASEQCRLALVRGEAGIGKTRLVSEFARAVHADGGAVLYGHFDEALGFAFQPFVEALRHYVAESPRTGLVPRLGPFGGELTRLLPELETQIPSLPSRLRADPGMETLRLYDAVAGWLAAASTHNPVLFVVEDLQWGSRPTFLLLRHVLRNAGPMRLLMVATYRDTAVHREHPLRDFVAELPRWLPALDRIDLAGLDVASVEALVAETLGGPLDGRGRELADALGAESGGNPFFLGELIRHVVATGGFVERGGRWTAAADVSETGIPEGLRDALLGHLRRVAPTTFDVLSTAAVLGEQFDTSVLMDVANVDEDALNDALEEAIVHRLVEEPADVRVPYRFSHALVRSALYEGLSASRRLSVHRRALEALEGSAVGGDRLDQLAYHAWQSAGAGDVGRALEYTLQAADRAVEHLSHDEAVTWYRRALGLLDAGGTQDTDTRFRLLMALGEAERRAGMPSSRETLLDAAGVAKLRGDATGLAQAALANTRGFFSQTGQVDRERVDTLQDALAAIGPAATATRARLLATLASELMWADDGDRRFALSDEALDIAHRLGDPRALADVLLLRGITVTAPDTVETRVIDTRTLSEVASVLDDPVVHFHAAHARLRLAVDIPDRQVMEDELALMSALADELRQPALSWLAALALASDDFFRGDLEAAEKRALEGLRLGDRAGQPEAVMFAGALLLVVRRLQGRLPELLDVAVAATDERGADYAHMAAMALCDAGRVDEARERYERVAAKAFDLRRDMVTGPSLANLAYLCSRFGDAAGAAVLYERLAPFADTMFQAMYGLLVTHHYLGMLAATMGRFDDADRHFARAAEVHDSLGAPLYAAETRIEWARALAGRGAPGDAERASQLATDARSVASDRGATALEEAAASVLDALGRASQPF